MWGHAGRLAAVGFAAFLLTTLSVVALQGAVAATSAGASPTTTLSVVPGSFTFAETTLGDYAGPQTFILETSSPTGDTIDLLTNDLTFSGPGADDYVILPGSDCPGNGVSTVVLGPGGSCTMDVYFFPGAVGDRPATATISGSADAGAGVTVSLSGTGGIGYYMVNAKGLVAHMGDAADYGDASDMPLNKPIVAMAATGDNGGYWLVATDGGIFNYGDAGFDGSAGGTPLNAPIVGASGG
ncbi:MAG: hypothetical protein ACLQU9_10965 [Acidimicrobiales bacterium]